jgi:hypothetical protein
MTSPVIFISMIPPGCTNGGNLRSSSRYLMEIGDSMSMMCGNGAVRTGDRASGARSGCAEGRDGEAAAAAAAGGDGFAAAAAGKTGRRSVCPG